MLSELSRGRSSLVFYQTSCTNHLVSGEDIYCSGDQDRVKAYDAMNDGWELWNEEAKKGPQLLGILTKAAETPSGTRE